MDERDFQIEASKALQNGQSILLLAPTGLGKTRACLKPFVEATPVRGLLGTRLIYALPLRALAQGVKDELTDLAKKSNYKWTTVIHHGGEPESRVFSEVACITTIDQYLTAFAGAPLSFASSSGHAAAGAILSSYSVFDEVHLLSPQKGLPLLFAVLKMRQRWGLLSAVMTATLPPSIVSYFEQNLGLKVINPSKEDVQQRDNWRKVLVSYQSQVHENFAVDTAIEYFSKYKKVIIFLNTVDRATEAYDELKQKLGTEKVLLAHSRFAPEHRAKREVELRDKFGRNSTFEGVLVTTQVSQAGLNISAPIVISELAPADSLVQYAGRCARFPKDHEQVEGNFIVFKPTIEKFYIPYDSELVNKTEEELKSLNGNILDWKAEWKFITESLDEYYSFYIRGEGLSKDKTKKAEAEEEEIDEESD